MKTCQLTFITSDNLFYDYQSFINTIFGELKLYIFFSPYKILPIAQENKYLGIFSYFIMKLYVVSTH